MKFLIQTINGKVKHDFSLTLIESIEFHHWYRNEQIFDTHFTDDMIIPDCIPIGSTEFVINYLNEYYNLTPNPKNVPGELIDKKWSGREIINGSEKDIPGRRFVKSNDKIKFFAEICDKAPQGMYQISEVIDIESEWRGFVYKNKLVGLQNYSGRFDIFPNVEKIKSMISAYKSQPIAFTIDVALNNGETVIIEVHDFFSCGLYGFADHKLLPYMFSDWFYSFINTKK